MATRFFNQQMRRMAGVCSPKDRRLLLRGTSISCFRSSAPPDRKRGRLSPSGEFRATSASLLSGRVAPACRRACSVNHSHRLLPEWSKGSGALQILPGSPIFQWGRLGRAATLSHPLCLESNRGSGAESGNEFLGAARKRFSKHLIFHPFRTQKIERRIAPRAICSFLFSVILNGGAWRPVTGKIEGPRGTSPRESEKIESPKSRESEKKTAPDRAGAQGRLADVLVFLPRRRRISEGSAPTRRIRAGRSMSRVEMT